MRAKTADFTDLPEYVTLQIGHKNFYKQRHGDFVVFMSYNTVIAVISISRKMMFLTNSSFSNTTSKHISLLRGTFRDTFGFVELHGFAPHAEQPMSTWVVEHKKEANTPWELSAAYPDLFEVKAIPGSPLARQVVFRNNQTTRLLYSMGVGSHGRRRTMAWVPAPNKLSQLNLDMNSWVLLHAQIRGSSHYLGEVSVSKFDRILACQDEQELLGMYVNPNTTAALSRDSALRRYERIQTAVEMARVSMIPDTFDSWSEYGRLA